MIVNRGPALYGRVCDKRLRISFGRAKTSDTARIGREKVSDRV